MRSRNANLSRGLAILAPVLAIVAMLGMAPVSAAPAHVPGVPAPLTPSARSGLQPNGRLLTPAGTLVQIGSLPRGGAVTADGRLLWTVSSGLLNNDVRIVDVDTQKVCRIIPLPGASGGVALDSRRRLAYVSGLPNSRWQPTLVGLPGIGGDVVHVISWAGGCSAAREVRTIPVPPQPDAPTTQAYPPPRAGLTTTPLAWPQDLAISPDGSRLLVPLNLADSAAVVDLDGSDRVRYVPAGGYPYGAAIAPGGRLGLVSNEASGTVTVVDMANAAALATITVGPPLSHPQGIVVDRSGRRAYVALSESDQVVVVDLRSRTVERTIWVGRHAGLGTKPTTVALSRAGDRLYVTESGADEISVVALPGSATSRAQRWSVIGRIPTAAQPQAVAVGRDRGNGAQLLWVAAEGLGIGANRNGPNPLLATDPIFWAFSSTSPTDDVFAGFGYTAKLVTGQAGILPVPDDAALAALTPDATEQLTPTNAQQAPAGTVLRAGGPIKHVFFIVRENRSYDQILGDDPRGNGDPKLTLFGKSVTPNLHALVQRFPLLDNVYANSEASIQGHYWTSAASVPDYVSRNWVQQYAGRGRPNDFATYAVTWPGNGFLFDQAEREGITYANFGEGFMGGDPDLPDRNRTPQVMKAITATMKHSDLGPPSGGCYPSDITIGTALDGQQIYDSSLPTGAIPGSYSHVDCFLAAFRGQQADDSVPAFTYLTLTSDHTRGTQPGYPTPRAMVADSDLAVGQIVDAISHSPIWSSSAIFLVEDDSQDGADHVNAHRIPVAVISPYARAGAVLHTRYDLVSVVRSIELILGMSPLSLNDALATPMYDAFTTRPVNSSPVNAITPSVDLLETNGPEAPDGPWSTRLILDKPDQVSQADLDVILWHSVHGADSPAPPPGPGAENEDPRTGD